MKRKIIKWVAIVHLFLFLALSQTFRVFVHMKWWGYSPDDKYWFSLFSEIATVAIIGLIAWAFLGEIDKEGGK